MKLLLMALVSAVATLVASSGVSPSVTFAEKD